MCVVLIMTYAEICRIGNNSLLRPDNIRPRLEAKVQTTQEVPTGFFLPRYGTAL